MPLCYLTSCIFPWSPNTSNATSTRPFHGCKNTLKQRIWLQSSHPCFHSSQVFIVFKLTSRIGSGLRKYWDGTCHSISQNNFHHFFPPFPPPFHPKNSTFSASSASSRTRCAAKAIGGPGKRQRKALRSSGPRISTGVTLSNREVWLMGRSSRALTTHLGQGLGGLRWWWLR